MAEVYAGLDVSDKSTHVCVMDGSGAVLWAGACAIDPEVTAKTMKSRAPGLVRVILETGPLSALLYHGLAERGVAVICVCARHANNLLARVKPPCALQTWGKTLAETKGPKRARVAVARKLAILLHRLWRSETEFSWT